MRRVDEPTGAGPRPVKRSFIDSRIDRMLDLCSRHGVALPPFALWRDADFRANPDAARLIAERGMGWNVVEFKPGLFAREGLTLFTLRMGDWRELGAGRGRLYAEKAILAEDGQRAPHHYHAVKTEDIVNRGGARFVVELFKVDARGAPLNERFRALKDVSVLDLGPGDQVRLEPGESLTLQPFVAHAFWAEGGAALAGEVSLANDDTTDNYFVPPLEPFPPIEEDAPARYVTVGTTGGVRFEPTRIRAEARGSTGTHVCKSPMRMNRSFFPSRPISPESPHCHILKIRIAQTMHPEKIKNASD